MTPPESGAIRERPERETRKRPNVVLRRIREEERRETRQEFADAMTRAAARLGEQASPSERYVARLEDGDIRYPHPAYRRVLAELCQRPFAELGFVRPGQDMAPSDVPGRDAAVMDDQDDSGLAVTPLQAARRDKGWSQGRAVWEITNLAAKKKMTVASARSLKTQLSRWENGHYVPDEFYRPLLCELFGLSPRELGGKKQASPPVGREIAFWTDVGALVMATAHESGDKAADHAGRLVPDASIDYLRAHVIYLARNFGSISPIAFLSECRESRDLALRLEERTKRPGQSADLYLITGQLCALMAEASFDLGIWPAVIEQSHASSLYAEMIGYRSLQSWALGMQAITAYWRGRAAEGVKLAEAGVALAPAGSARAHLHSVLARAWSHVGDPERTRAALALADRDRDGIGDSGGDELRDVIGGQFAWGPARQTMSAASALLAIGDAFQSAERAREAIRLQPEDQAGQRVSVLARADLAYAELAQGHADAVEETLTPIWELESGQRRYGLVERLGNISVALAGKSHSARPRMAKNLIGRIAAFTAVAAPKALPPGAAIVPGSE